MSYMSEYAIELAEAGQGPGELPPVPPDPYAEFREADDWEALFDHLYTEDKEKHYGPNYH